MTYDEFIEHYKMHAHKELGYDLERMKFYPEGFTSDDPIMVEWIKDSNLRYVGKEDTKLLMDILTMEVPGKDNVSSQHRIAIRQMYELVQNKGIEAVFEDLHNLNKDIRDVDVSRFRVRVRGTYEDIREQLILRPLNYNLHIRDLQGCVYRKVNDFVLCLYQVLSNNEHVMMTSKIKRDELTKWGIEENQVLQNALENTARLYPPCVYDQRTKKEENFLEKEFSRDDITMQEPHSKLILLSTFNSTNGAVALFYPGVMEKMMKIMGGPFQAVFMNTSDVLIFDKDDKNAYQFAKKAQQGKTGLGELLSGRIFLCDGTQMIPGIVVKAFMEDDEMDNQEWHWEDGLWSFIEVVQWVCLFYKLEKEENPGACRIMTDHKKMKKKAEEYGMTMRAIANEMYRNGKCAKALLDEFGEDACIRPKEKETE